MTFGISMSLVPLAAVNTALLPWDGDDNLMHALTRNAIATDRDPRWHHTHLSSRRAKSHSPSRRLPKIKHTNGRLDEDPIAVAVIGTMQHPTVSTTSGVAAPLRCSNTKNGGNTRHLLARLHSTHMVSSSSSSHAATIKCAMSDFNIPSRVPLRRSSTAASQHGMQQSPFVSTEDSTYPSSSPTRRLMACYRDAAARDRSANNTRRLIALACQQSDPDLPQADGSACERTLQNNASINQQTLARKALKYRKLLARAQEIDASNLADPTFDVLEGLGVVWCSP